MITEDYVSFEVAKLLKEKGFDERCRAFITPNVNFALEEEGVFNHLLSDKEYSAPTHQMVLKWLRETYNIFIQIDCVVLAKNSFDYVYEIHDMCKGHSITTSTFRDNYETYEKAIEAAIKYCLINLI